MIPLTYLVRAAFAIARVQEVFRVRYRDLAGPSRAGDVALARHAAMAAIHGAGVQLKDVGALLGGRHHSTVLHGIREVCGRARRDPRLAEQLRELEVGR